MTFGDIHSKYVPALHPSFKVHPELDFYTDERIEQIVALQIMSGYSLETNGILSSNFQVAILDAIDALEND
eukprot:CAMPEP_0117426292 /NCGR_PEP_ID=MMETSP0758-20121206/6450_1 /TAXON_ID=63605 /ORGANISM="Percolomonas cosmopolitus, Strain AE-1 (ATCC 50343)" /LENGTH=70 /DNA_ID=CAMNT_0005211403 /DNA_START=542 /DNA_END=751 /DNA_ORIENTATION=-